MEPNPIDASKAQSDPASLSQTAAGSEAVLSGKLSVETEIKASDEDLPAGARPSEPDDLTRRIFEYASHAYSGPMPPPELLRAYAAISPDLPNRMMAMAETAQSHAHEREMSELQAAREDMQRNWSVVRWGQFFGFGIGVAALTAGVTCLRIAPNAAGASMGTILGGGGIATLIWAFRYDRSE